MGNIIDYAEKEMARMWLKSFNAVDSLVLSQFSYIHFDHLVPSLLEEAAPVRIGDVLKAEFFEQMFRDVRDADSNRKLLFALAASPRFRDIQLSYYVDKVEPVLEKQFSALTFLLEDQTAYIAYRGTDANLIGWKEDFNMAFTSPVPSQEEGVGYLQTIAGWVPGLLRIGGHSKGGNIAVYSAMKCDAGVQDRIIGIYNHDGPGFVDSVFETQEYNKIKDRVHKTLPQSSLVGMLMQHLENYQVVESKRFGILQHDPFSWFVENDDFRYAEKVSLAAMHRHKTIDQWLSALSKEQRELFIDTLYQVIEATDSDTIYEFSEDWLKKALAMLNALKNIDSETMKFMGETINDLVKLSIKNLRMPGK
ncbi:MAG TPA: hypothetical protein DIT32_06750 [Peptococcaceae bacterium]|nr:hypothetical protein [Peptococcaceae bacterium]